MKNKQQELEQKVQHYKKLRHKWIIARRTVQGIGFVSTVFLGVGAIIVTGGFFIPFLPTILTGSGIGSLTIFSIVDKSLFKLREKSIRTKEYKIKEVINKLHFYFEKVREDNIITTEEIESFDKIVNEVYTIQNKPNDGFLEELVVALKAIPEPQLKSLMQKRQL